MEKTTFLVLCSSVSVIIICDSPFDFGLLENELLMTKALHEDQLLTKMLKIIQKEYNNEVLNLFLNAHVTYTNESHIKHPIDSYHIIKKYSDVFPNMLKKIKTSEIKRP